MSRFESSVVIGDPRAAHLRLQPIQRERPVNRESHDGNWLITEVRIQAGGFRGAFRANLHLEEFDSFRDSLERLYGRLEGRSVFASREGWLRVVVEGDGRGHLEARCEATDDPAIGNRLSFLILFDQSYLPETISGLNAILAEHSRLAPV